MLFGGGYESPETKNQMNDSVLLYGIGDNRTYD